MTDTAESINARREELRQRYEGDPRIEAAARAISAMLGRYTIWKGGHAEEIEKPYDRDYFLTMARDAMAAADEADTPHRTRYEDALREIADLKLTAHSYGAAITALGQAQTIADAALQDPPTDTEGNE